MANEPEIPLMEGDMPKDPAEIEAKVNPENGKSDAGKTGEDDKSKQGDDKGGETVTVSAEQYKKLAEGWKEDREYYQGEVKRLRAEATNPKLTDKEEEELEGLDEDERVEKKIEFREKRREAAKQAELEAVKREIRFYERTDQEFADNKREILKVAEQYDCPNLKQAILVWRGLNADKAKKDAIINDERKKEADGKGGGNANGKTTGKPFDPKTDGKKSFGDFYREGGV